MCNFYKLRKGPAELRERFGVQRDLDFSGNLGPIDCFPRRAAPVIRRRADGAREMVMLDWGHPYYKREKDGSLTLKKNGEPYAPTPTTNIRHPHYPMFRDYLAPVFRCLVPATRFAEPDPARSWARTRSRSGTPCGQAQIASGSCSICGS